MWSSLKTIKDPLRPFILQKALVNLQYVLVREWYLPSRMPFQATDKITEIRTGLPWNPLAHLPRFGKWLIHGCQPLKTILPWLKCNLVCKWSYLWNVKYPRPISTANPTFRLFFIPTLLVITYIVYNSENSFRKTIINCFNLLLHYKSKNTKRKVIEG